jgi:hypothetical protein
MTNLTRGRTALRAATIIGAMGMGLAFSTSAVAGEKQNAKDQQTCASMGAPFGSPGYTNCMLQQQQREDEKMPKFLAEMRMHQELGREARETLQRKRDRRDREQYCR